MRPATKFICGLSIVLSILTTSSAMERDEGFLNATCNEAQDCYVIDDTSKGLLHLYCWYDVHKCICSNSFHSNFHLKWDNIDRKCLMSKYGPCGAKGADLVVGCQDNFVCIDNQCRDPKDTSAKAVKLTPFEFEESQCFSSNVCQFSEDLHLSCNRILDRCNCEKVDPADARGTYWDLRNYDGDRNCSAGKFGPCGIRNGIIIECHGDGITCVSGTCVNASHPISDLGEECAYDRNCKGGLLCSDDSVCIEPFSVESGKRCTGTTQCREGLLCRYSRIYGSSYCQDMLI